MAAGGKGVRVATAYIDIQADTTALRDALDKAASDSSKNQAAGKKIGTDVAKGIDEGLKKAPKSDSVLGDLIQGKTGSGTVRAAGEKFGKELGTGIAKGIDTQEVGKTVNKQLLTAVGQANPGTAIGKELGKTLAEEAGKAVRAEVGAWGRQIGADLGKGDFKAAADDIATPIKNLTTTVYDLGTAIGVHLDAVKGFGEKAGEFLDGIATKAGGIRDKLSGAADGIKKMHEGGTAGKIQGLADATGNLSGAAKDLGINLGGVPDKIISMAGAAGGVAALADSFATLGASLGIIASPAVVAALGLLAAPLAAGSFAWWMMQPGQNPRNWQIAPQLGSPITQTPANQMPLPGQLPPAQIPSGAPPGTQYTVAPGDINNPFSAMIPPGWTFQNGQLVPPGASPVPSAGGAGTGVTLPGAPGAATPNPFPMDTGGTSTPSGVTSGAPSWSQIDSIASRFGLTVGSSYRPPNGPTIAGVPAAQSYHSSGRAHDYNGTPQQRLAFAQYMAANYGLQLKELIYDAPGFTSTIHNGQNVGPFGAFYTMGQAGYHGDHVHIAFDDGGTLPPGSTLAINNTGQDEQVLTPEQIALLQKRAPATAAAIGFGPQPSDQPGDVASGRTSPWIPAGAGSQAVAGTSFVAGLLNLGNEAVAGLIDTGASAAQMALSAGLNAAAPGSGAAAGAAGGFGIQLAANEAKRAVSYGFQMGAIGADALIEQAFGMFGGPPRWIGYDYTQFMPNIDLSGIGTTTVEKLMSGGRGGQPGGPVEAAHLPGAQPVGPPVPKFGTPPGPLPGPGGLPGGDLKTAGPPDLKTAGPPPPTPTPPPGERPDLFNILGMDSGGWLPHGSAAFNTSGRPELVLSASQLDTLAPASSGGWGRGDNYYITAVNAEDVGRQIDKRKSLAMMRYSGRP